jgi:hypothetical protein
MQNAPPAPPCPNCGKLKSKAIAQHYDYPVDKGAWNSEPRSITYAYQCQCGAGFTHTVKHDPPKGN